MMAERSLKALVTDWAFPRFTLDDRVPRVKLARKQVEKAFGRLQGRPPEGLDSRKLLVEVSHRWQDSGSLAGIQARSLRRLPWVMFAPPPGVPSAFLMDPRFTTAFKRWSLERTSGSRFATLLQAFLRFYPESTELREPWRRFLVKHLGRHDGMRARRWAHRCNRFGLLTLDGPRRLGSKMLDSGGEGERLLEEAGFTGFMADARFVRSATLGAVDEVEHRLSRRSAPDASSLSDWLSVFLTAEMGLRFEELRVPLAEKLLSPWFSRTPETDVRETIMSFLLGALGDPRLQREAWHGVSSGARKVFLSWLVQETLEDFFRIIDATALSRHWKERKEFWGGYLDAGAISEAWLILGTDARIHGRKVLRDSSAQWGKLKGGQPGHSVLLLRVRNVTVIEWSHSGAARFWLEGHSKAPKPYMGIYHAFRLRAPCDHRVIHDQGGKWKRNMRNWIGRETGIYP